MKRYRMEAAMKSDEKTEILSLQKKEKVFDLTVYAPQIAKGATPGQFVHIKCGDKTLLRRPLSICDCEQDRLRILFEVRGEGTRWLARREKGEILSLLGPLGHGFSLDKAGRHPLVIGGGIGAPPMLFLAKTLKKRGTDTEAILGFRNKGASMLIEEFSGLGKVQVATDDGSAGYHGFVHELLQREIENRNPFTMLYACGPKPMLKAVAQVAAENNIPLEVSMEERMGCGIGACLVCACKTRAIDGREEMRHVCKDGPVFDAREVIFDD